MSVVGVIIGKQGKSYFQISLLGKQELDWPKP